MTAALAAAQRKKRAWERSENHSHSHTLTISLFTYCIVNRVVVGVPTHTMPYHLIHLVSIARTFISNRKTVKRTCNIRSNEKWNIATTTATTTTATENDDGDDDDDATATVTATTTTTTNDMWTNEMPDDERLNIWTKKYLNVKCECTPYRRTHAAFQHDFFSTLRTIRCRWSTFLRVGKIWPTTELKWKSPGTKRMGLAWETERLTENRASEQEADRREKKNWELAEKRNL